MTFLSILRVREILYSLGLVLEGKTGKKILMSSRLEFLEKFLANKFALSDVEDNTSGPLNREERRYSRFIFADNTIRNPPKVQRPTFLGSHGLFCFISICKFGSFKNRFAVIASLSELHFRF